MLNDLDLVVLNNLDLVMLRKLHNLLLLLKDQISDVPSNNDQCNNQTRNQNSHKNVDILVSCM